MMMVLVLSKRVFLKKGCHAKKTAVKTKMAAVLYFAGSLLVRNSMELIRLDFFFCERTIIAFKCVSPKRKKEGAYEAPSFQFNWANFQKWKPTNTEPVK